MKLLKLYDQGLLSEGEEIDLFQKLIDSGEVWELPNQYQKVALNLIDEGICEDKG